jgi:hypothetical protein
MSNETFFESSNGWQFQVSDSGHVQYRFQDDSQWTHLGTQLALGMIEWAQSPVWSGEDNGR